MAFGKWIGGFFGFAKGGVLGAIVGYVMGSLFDNFLEKQQQGQQEEMWGKANDNREYATPRGTDTRDDFLFSLMVLCAHMIHADGKVMHSEMENVRKFLRQNFGETAVTEGNRILLNLFDYKKQQGTLAWQQQIRQSCAQMSLAMPEEHRIQLVAFLAEIAKADGKVLAQEIEALKQIAMLLGMGVGLVDQLLNLGGTTLEEAYKVLGISADATDEEVRKAYRKMVIQHHPDKVQNLGEDVKEAATRKLQEINKAKEMIFKARGLD